MSKAGKISKPAALKPGHDLDSFDCEHEQLNAWLKNRAIAADANDTARTYVICRGTRRVIGFYALAAGALEHAGAPGALRRNAPDPVPVIILARLGVHKAEKGQGLGRDLLSDAMRRCLMAAQQIAARALLVHALNDNAAKFYKAHGFSEIKAGEEPTLFISMKTMRAALS